MSASTVYCHILNDNITIITDMDGNVKKVACPQLNDITTTCYVKFDNQGFAKNLLARYVDVQLGTKYNYCEFL